MDYKEIYYNTRRGFTFSAYKENLSSILIIFLHGAGDSHLNYLRFINHPLLTSYDILIPDIIGYGKSQRACSSFLFVHQVEALEQTIQCLPKQYSKIILVPHSMAGIHAVLLAQGMWSSHISGIYAVETTVTQYGAFISEEVTKQAKSRSNLTQWFNGFCDKVYNQGIDMPVLRIYHAGLKLTTMRCFTQNCIDMRKLATAEKQMTFSNRIGHAFVKLNIPKAYCFAQSGQQTKSLPFLKAHNIKMQSLPTESHFCMQLCSDQFVKNLHIWIQRST